MLNLMLAFLVPTSIGLALSFWLLQKKRQEEAVKMQATYAKKILDIRSAYETTLDLFVIQRVIRPAHEKSLLNIVNNFFVNQPINEHNVNRLETLANAITFTIAREVNLTRNEDDLEWLKRKLLAFAIRLPTSRKDYNQTFYSARIKHLLNGLNTTRANFVSSQAA